jgi:type II secretory pathway component PulJ
MMTRSSGLPSLRRRAFSLMEVCTVMAALAIISTVLVVTLGGALKVEKASSGALERLLTLRDLADQFRADVASAADTPKRWQQEEAGPTCLILSLGKDHHVLYRGDAQRLVRLEHEGDKTYRQEIALSAPVAVEFERSPASSRLITLHLFCVRKDGRKGPSAEIAAMLGGDLE